MVEFLSLLQQGQNERTLESMFEQLQAVQRELFFTQVVALVFIIGLAVGMFYLNRHADKLQQRLDRMDKEADIEKRVKAATEKALES